MLARTDIRARHDMCAYRGSPVEGTQRLRRVEMKYDAQWLVENVRTTRSIANHGCGNLCSQHSVYSVSASLTLASSGARMNTSSQWAKAVSASRRQETSGMGVVFT